VRAIVLDNVWKVCLSYLASRISTTHLVALRVLIGFWAKLELSLSALEMLDARLELQIIDIPHGQEDFINGDGLFFEVQHGTYIM
jgi:hypothetical protein